MNVCKAKLPDGKLCPNQADTGQQYCPFHLAKQVSPVKKITMGVLTLIAIVKAAKSVPWKNIAPSVGKLIPFAKNVMDKIRHI